MIVGALELILTPFILAMDLAFGALHWVTGSAGWSIILLSFATALLTQPLRAWAQVVENRVRLRKLKVDGKIAAETSGLKGEKKFRVIERIYKEDDYHPIHSIALGTPLFVMLPILLSALFLFSSNSLLEGVPFLFISDLSQPDGLFLGFNLLPVVMTGITLVDSRIRFGTDRSAFGRFLVIALVLFVLVYSFASAIVLFWTVSNLAAMLTYLIRHSNLWPLTSE
jgi:YidC/Oxa1 family membrane protein insertase